MKYRPDFPERFGSVPDARHWGGGFFQWYNHEHYHSGLGLMTPAQVHYEAADEAHAHRQQVLHVAYQANPERFVRGVPRPPDLPKAVWINKPKSTREDQALLH